MLIYSFGLMNYDTAPEWVMYFNGRRRKDKEHVWTYSSRSVSDSESNSKDSLLDQEQQQDKFQLKMVKNVKANGKRFSSVFFKLHSIKKTKHQF